MICVLFPGVGTPARSSSAEVFITITNINDNVPEFDQETYPLVLAESATVGTTVLTVNSNVYTAYVAFDPNV